MRSSSSNITVKFIRGVSARRKRLRVQRLKSSAEVVKFEASASSAEVVKMEALKSSAEVVKMEALKSSAERVEK